MLAPNETLRKLQWKHQGFKKSNFNGQPKRINSQSFTGIAHKFYNSEQKEFLTFHIRNDIPRYLEDGIDICRVRLMLPFRKQSASVEWHSAKTTKRSYQFEISTLQM